MTEAEIRAAVDRMFVDNGTLNAAGVISDGFAEARGAFCQIFEHEEMSDSETERLHELITVLIEPIEAEATRQCHEALTKAALQFAAEYPDAQRKRQPVTA
jgi:hypothetical protein